MFLLLFWLLAAISLLIIFYFYITWSFNYWKNLGVLGPKPKLIFGSFPGTFMRKINILYEVDNIYK